MVLLHIQDILIHRCDRIHHHDADVHRSESRVRSEAPAVDGRGVDDAVLRTILRSAREGCG